MEGQAQGKKKCVHLVIVSVTISCGDIYLMFDHFSVLVEEFMSISDSDSRVFLIRTQEGFSSRYHYITPFCFLIFTFLPLLVGR